jgi:hypothetical protein
MRGFNATSFYAEQDAKSFCNLWKSIGCDTIRWQLNAPSGLHLQSLLLYEEWLKEECEKFLSVAASAPGLKFILDLHSVFGGATESAEHKFVIDEYFRSHWFAHLTYLTSLITNAQNCIGLEIANEPHAKTKVYRKCIEDNLTFFRSLARRSNRKIYISTAYGSENRIENLPVFKGRLVQTTAHYWPRASLIGVPGYTLDGTEEKFINSPACVGGLNKIYEYEQKTKAKILLGEIGCTKGVGEELQRAYIKKCLNFVKKHNIQVLVHGEIGNPIYNYENNGIFDEIAKIFK